MLWGKNPAKRLPEATAFAKWMRDWADRPNDWNTNLMVLGDFNLDRIGDPLYEAFISKSPIPGNVASARQILLWEVIADNTQPVTTETPDR
ncbi:hypothetical protein [Arthrobacter sp. ISL-72]|uniref:hypothetical protein n=1 Tax=Arthrobacter sp. ISL-72 TaxID=2819114 RepID=UPI001BE72E64|nr:hypothetical protein [Arthrobacter sp. ISL-72]MBT2597998.1 hypothetical protein [Arthrobacter sp. ISL-72]